MKILSENSMVTGESSFIKGREYDVPEERAEEWINLGWAERVVSDEEKTVMLLKKFESGLVVIPGKTPTELIDLCATLNIPTQVHRERKAKAPKEKAAE